MNPELLFVYGTLKQSVDDGANEMLQTYTRYLGTATVPGQLYLYEDGEFVYPGLVVAVESAQLVHGELYQIDDSKALFTQLDTYEGCTKDDPVPHQYRRQSIVVTSEQDETHHAWTYVYQWPTDGLTRIVDGNFR